MTDRGRAEDLVGRFPVPEEQLLRKLEDVLGKAQNSPPLGAADGTIDEESWYALRAYINALRELRRARKAFMRIR